MPFDLSHSEITSISIKKLIHHDYAGTMRTALTVDSIKEQIDSSKELDYWEGG